MTSSTMIRGYSLRQTARYIETRLEPELSRRAIETLPPDTRKLMGAFEPAEWYPRSHAIALYRSIVSVRGGDAAFPELMACGEFIASEATNTFLRLLMKIMTPTLFAKKVPDFWTRDQKGGHFEVDVSAAGDGKIAMTLVDVGDYEHIAGIAGGFIRFGMVALGKKGVSIEQTGWSLATPSPRDVHYQIRWS